MNESKKTPAPIVLHTIPETAQILKVSVKTVRRMIDARELLACRVGQQLRINDSDLRAFLNAGRMV